MPTIAAIATPPGYGGIGIVRVNGSMAKDLLARVFLPFSPHFENFRPWLLHRGRVLDSAGEPLDDALAVFMPGPRTFTGEDMAELHCHGGPLIVQAALESLLALGARQAERGEFSRRAFVNGRMELSQAEAVAEMISAPSREDLRYSLNRLDGLLGSRVLDLREALENVRVQLCLAVDFPEDEVECLAPQDFALAVEDVAAHIRRLLAGTRRAALMRNGAMIPLVGAVNAGKSSLLNALLGRNRAIVTELPGTTRDFLEELCNLDGLPVRLTDTAGLRATPATSADRPAPPAGPVEALGTKLSYDKLEEADAVVLVLDGARLGKEGAKAATCPDPAARQVLRLAGGKPLLLAWNKCDICAPSVWPPRWAKDLPCRAVSALTGEHIDDLARDMRALALNSAQNAPPEGLAPNARQAFALEQALAELENLAADIQSGQPYDCCATRLDAAAAHLGEVTGISCPAQMLDSIFSQFCIGK
ncbi:MAG: tRNA uridine-5-carboxymethylaminomethyl(34) synthesis GTPase MnmE [Desulfovibrio sp.]|nr:tRNA uridine-5-carboxymethylaminomethyl(34) synthesis GTPase MnmE [Desulfovibrio sp.]